MNRHDGKIRGFLWDIDGTLLDSNDAHARAYERAMAVAEVPRPFEQIRKLIGKGGDHLLPELLGAGDDSDLGKRVNELKTAFFDQDYFHKLEPFPCARELVAHLHSMGYRMGVATSASKDELGRFLDKVGVRKYMHAEASADDVVRSKPDPDIVRSALGRLGLPATEVMMVGDTPYDIEAAFRAGVRSIAFRSGGWPDHALQGAERIYDGAAEMLEDLPQLFEKLNSAGSAGKSG